MRIAWGAKLIMRNEMAAGPLTGPGLKAPFDRTQMPPPTSAAASSHITAMNGLRGR
jgi:hypothetical protein